MGKISQPLGLINDLAIGEGNSFNKDGLGFNIYSQIIGESIVNSATPFTVGIFGEWGTGKTSLMRMIEKYLQDRDEKSTITIWFNAWRFERDEHPLIPLVAHIVQEVKKKKSFTSSLADGGKSLLEALRAVAYGVSAKAKLNMPGFAEIEAAFVAKDMIERSEQLTSDPLLDRSLYYDAFNSLSKVNFGGSKRVVIFVDDLDRCLPDMALKLLESIKLIFSQPSFVFVIGASRTVLEGYIQYRYEQEYGLSNFDGRSYFDKIIQLPFHIPPHSGRIKQFSESLIRQINDIEAKNEIKSVLEIIEISGASNPRSIIRFINNLLIDRAINKNLFTTDETDYKIEIGYFAVTRSIQQNWREFFDLLIRSKELCYLLSMFDNFKEIDKVLFEKVLPANKINIINKMENNNDFEKILFSPAGKNWLKNENLRISAIDFILTKRADTTSADLTEIKKYVEEHIINKKGVEVLPIKHKYIDFEASVQKYEELRSDKNPSKSLIDLDVAVDKYLQQQKRVQKDSQSKE